jgi:hypothetical protein
MALIRLGTSPEPTIVVAAPGSVTFYTLKARALQALDLKLSDTDVPRSDADYVAVGAADLDGDGVDDLALMVSSSSIHFLRGNPVLE